MDIIGSSFGVDWALFWLICQLGFWLAIFIGMLFFVLNRFRYRYWVIIFERTGDKDQIVMTDEAKVIKDKNGIKKLWIKGERKRYPLIDFQYKRNCRGGGLKKLFKRGTFILYKYGEDSYTPLDLKTTIKDNGENKDVELFALDSEKAQIEELFQEIEVKTDFKSKWKELTPIIVSVTIGLFLVGGLVVTMIMNEHTQETLRSAIGSNVEIQKVNAGISKDIAAASRYIAQFKDGGEKPPSFEEAERGGS